MRSLVMLATIVALFDPSAGIAQRRTSPAETARALYVEADFAGARAATDAVVASSDASREELALVYAVLAVLDALEGRPEVARDVAIALALDPATVAPDGAPRSVLDAFERERAARGGRRARIALAVRQGEPAHAAARLDDVPSGLIARLELHCVIDGRAVERASAGDPIELQLPAGGARCEATASTAAGAVVLRESAELQALAIGEDVAVQPADDPAPWIVLGTLGALALVGGAIALGVVLGSQGERPLGAPTVMEW